MKNNNDLIAALMIQIIWKCRMVYWNVNQEPWGDDRNCSEWFRMEPMELGGIKVEVERSDDGCDSWAFFSFGGVRISTERSTKRLFHYAHGVVMSEQQWVAWFNSVMAELHRLDEGNWNRLVGRKEAE